MQSSLSGGLGPGNPLFSLITITLNPGEGFRRTVESVKAQGFSNFEHLVKDGNSTDGSLEAWAVSDGQYRPRVVRQADGGIYDAMNQGLALARGKFVLFLNAGDTLYASDTLESVAATLEAQSSLALVYGDYLDSPLQMVIKSPRKISRFFLFRNTLCHQACFFSRETLNELGGFDTSLRVLADYDMLVRAILVAKKPHVYLEKTLACAQGGGFSSILENARHALKEAELIRQRNFHGAELLWFNCLRSVTLPQVRFRLMRSKRLALLKRVYTWTANLWNGW